MKTPISVILICLLFIIAGLSGIIYHASEWKDLAVQPEDIWVFLLRLSAIVGGIFAWRGHNWARWLLLAWIAYHVVLSFYHTTPELIMHAILMVVTFIALFNRKANAYFKS
jgi:cytochrome b561